jgi:hypothetical protein
MMMMICYAYLPWVPRSILSTIVKASKNKQRQGERNIMYYLYNQVEGDD